VKDYIFERRFETSGCLRRFWGLTRQRERGPGGSTVIFRRSRRFFLYFERGPVGSTNGLKADLEYLNIFEDFLYFERGLERSTKGLDIDLKN
jgi:hypothetical protein